MSDTKPTLGPRLGSRHSGECRNPEPGAELWTPGYAGVTNRFHPAGSAQQFLSLFSRVCNLFRPHRHFLSAAQ
jgi:hypothetical protein